MSGLIYVLSDGIWWLVAFILHYHFQNETSHNGYNKKKYIYWMSSLTSTMLMVFTYNLRLGYFRYLIYIILCIFISYYRYESPNKFKLIRSALYAVISSILILQIYQWVEEQHHRFSNHAHHTAICLYPVLTTCAIIIFLFIYRIIIMIYSTYVGNRPTIAEVSSFLLIMCFSFGFLMFIIEIHNNLQFYMKYEVYIFALLLGVVIINIYFLSYVGYLTRSNMLQKKLLVEKEKNDMTYQYYQALDQSYSDCRKVFHDVNNHLQMLKALYESGEETLASKYEHTLEEEIIQIKPKYYTENKILNIILFDKEKKANESNIIMHYKIEEAEFGFISDYDLVTILCNLFDNAITECERLFHSKREIVFKVRKVNGFLIIYIENPMLESYMSDNERKRFMHHLHTGTGFNNVRYIVHKYKGTYSVNIDNQKFIVSIQFCL